ncbi:hypothetical protein [Serratia sp. M24T3]|uniref:hypothetical protein n=1 Tax=Serratia sp. M24T3 TaxID=932213 RepID=UPI00025BAB25|nr:hypothetical protein [Serratia sp. M24T3]EIC82095.1 hypothetical protein SPM24T3_23702 [Serratia sp. M24T3]
MINKTAIILTAVILLIIALLMWAAFHYYGKSVSTADQLTTAVQQKKEAEFITNSQALSVGIFNQIAGATLNDQKTNTSASQGRQTIIKTVLETAPCNLVLVPTAATDSLRDHYNAVRQGAINTDTGKPTAVLPAVPAT